jgi:hypothetical protein
VETLTNNLAKQLHFQAKKDHFRIPEEGTDFLYFF